MGLYYDRVSVSVASAPGTGVITLGPALRGARSFADAGVTNGTLVAYVIEDGADWEIGKGTYASSGPTLTRTTIISSSNGGAAIDASGDAFVNISIIAEELGTGGGLTTLTANTTYYVRQDGSDTNDGLANTAGGAFRTINHAMLLMNSIDAAGFNVTIQIGDGTWTEKNAGIGTTGVIACAKRPLNCATFSILGNPSTPANCVLDAYTATATNCILAYNGVIIDLISGFTLSGGGTKRGFYLAYGVSAFTINSVVCSGNSYCVYCLYNSLIKSVTISISGASLGILSVSNSSAVSLAYLTFNAGSSVAYQTTAVSANSSVLIYSMTTPENCTGTGANKFVATSFSTYSCNGTPPGSLEGTVDATSKASTNPTFALTKLTAATTYYVRQDGSDGNNGLANTAAGAFRTIAFAMQIMNYIDANGYAVTIQIGGGTWTEKTGGLSYGAHTFVIACQKRPINCSTFSILGNTTTPANCVLDAATATATRCVLISNGTVVNTLAGFTMSGGGTKGGVLVFSNSTLNSMANVVMSNVTTGLMVRQSSGAGVSGGVSYADFSVSGTLVSAVSSQVSSTVFSNVTFNAGSSITGNALDGDSQSAIWASFVTPENCTPVAGSQKFMFTGGIYYYIGGTPPGELAGTASASCYTS
jgi:hypothetical protein